MLNHRSTYNGTNEAYATGPLNPTGHFWGPKMYAF